MNPMRQAIIRSALGPPTLAEGSAEQSFCFAEDFPGFAGHFPGYPILPAILQTLMAQLVAEQLCGYYLEFQGLERAKFTRELRPAEQILVRVSLRDPSELLRYKAEISCGAEIAAVFNLSFTAGEPA